MNRELTIALRMTVATLVLTGLAYPLAVTALAGVLFPHRAGGSLVTRDARVVRSAGSRPIKERDPAVAGPRIQPNYAPLEAVF